MVSTRKSKRVATDSDEDEKVPQIREEEPQDSGSDSDDAPEEVTFVKSKKNAATLRQQEVDAKKQLAESKKERRNRRQRLQEAEAQEAAAVAAAAVTAEEEDDDAEEEQGIEDIDMLPDDVLDALVENEAKDRRVAERRMVTEQLRARRKPKQRRTFTERQAGPVTVKVLKPGMNNRKASDAARSFFQQRLESGVKRSNGMLQPTKIGGVFVFPKA